MLPVIRNGGRTLWRDPLETMRRDFDGLVNQLFNPESTTWAASYPVDIWEDENNLYVDAEMPGFAKDQIDVTFENGVLTISAERSQKQEQKKGERHLYERRHSRVYRSFTLPTAIDESKVKAKVEEGVLHLTLPKREEVKPRKIKLE